MIGQFLFKTDRRCRNVFIRNMAIKGMIGFKRFEKRKKKGNFFPAFHFISITDVCNLNCQGCWVIGKKENKTMSMEMLDKIIEETKLKGSYFFGILGGEPLMYKNLIKIFQKHKDCYFQLFTNGTLLTEGVAENLRLTANVTPLISFEGDESVADIRRGGKDVFQLANRGIDNSTFAGLITGVAISVCKSNIEMATSGDFVKSMMDKGVMYLWYYIYRPVGESATPDLCLNKEEIERLRKFIIEARNKYKLIIIDTYWDAKGKGFCPAALGLSHHINTSGFIEPCPVVQFATDRVGDKSLEEIYLSSGMLNDFRNEIPEKTNGCIIMEDPEWLAGFLERHNATDTSGRENELERLRNMQKVCSHGSISEIPEKKLIYRFLKKNAFMGLGAYG